MPRQAEFIELYNSCMWEIISFKGTLGYKVTGPNGNSIFLPYTYYRIGETILTDAKAGACHHNIVFCYWTSNKEITDERSAWMFWACDKGHVYRSINTGWLWRGNAVRPVIDY